MTDHAKGYPCVEIHPRPRWRRKLEDFRRDSRIAQWGWWPAFWYHVHAAFNQVVFGEGYGRSDWGHDHTSIMVIHHWLCRRWVPANERYLSDRTKTR